MPRRRPTKRTESGRVSPVGWTTRGAMRSSVPPQWRRHTGASEMDQSISDPELAELLGPEPVKGPVERRHPFKEYTYEELINSPKKVYLCGDDGRPVLLADSLWQTMGRLKSGK